jgi:hypothetical protein
MVEPFTPDRVKGLSNFARTAHSFGGRREERGRLESTLQEALDDQLWVVLLPGEPGTGETRLLQDSQSDVSHHCLQIGYGWGYEDLTLARLPFVEILQAPLDQSPLENEQTLSTNLQDSAEFHCWAGLAHRWDQDAGHCRVHHEGPIRACWLAGNIWGLAEALVEKTQTYLALASIPLGTLVDLQSLDQSNTESPPVLRCARP